MRITFTELKEILANEAELRAIRFERELLKQQILELLVGDAAVQAKVQAAFDKSEAVEDKMRAATVGR